MEKAKSLAIIPARTNSKRLSGKNFIDWFGRPIIEGVVEEVEKSELFGKIIVSSDYPDAIASFEANPFLPNWLQYYEKRPKDMSTYECTVDDICSYVLRGEKKSGRKYDYICCIYPTAYAVKAEDLKASFKLLNSKAEFVHSRWMLNHKQHNLDYQSDNGGFYWAKINTFLKQKTLMGKPSSSYGVEMVDINTYEDYIDAMAHRLSMTDYLRRDCKCAI